MLGFDLWVQGLGQLDGFWILGKGLGAEMRIAPCPWCWQPWWPVLAAEGTVVEIVHIVKQTPRKSPNSE